MPRCKFIYKSRLFWQIELFVQAENMFIYKKVTEYIKCKKLYSLCTEVNPFTPKGSLFDE